MSSFMGAVTMRCVVRSSRFQTKKVIIPQELDNFAWRFRLSLVELFVKELSNLSLQAFAIFCGLGIHNTMIYDQMAKAKAKQQVAIEVS